MYNVKNVEEDFNIATDNHKKKKFSIAEKIYKKILKTHPNHFETNYLLATLFLQTQRFKDAKIMFIKSIKIKSDNVDALNNFALTLNELGEYEKAIIYYKKAISIKPDYAYAYNNLGNIYKNLKDFNKSISCYIDAIKKKPDYVDAHKNLMQIYEKTNQEKNLENAISNAHSLIKGNKVPFLYEGILLFRNKKYKKAIQCLEKISFPNLDKDINKESTRVETLAKCHNMIKNYKEAFNYFVLANKFYPIQAKNVNFDKNKYIEEVKIRKDFFTNKKIDKWSNHKIKKNNKDPIFLIGFPRSGTTLLDTILRTHPNINVMEEKGIVAKLVKSINELSDGDLNILNSINESQIEKVRKDYFDARKLVTIKQDKSIIYIDKLPLNIIHVGEIYRIFPNSKFIFAVRHPCDCVLSCFMQNFKLNNAMANFLNLNDAAKLYDDVIYLWFKFKSILSINYYEVKYENLINNFERTIKSVLNFLDLPWDSSVLKYYETAKDRNKINTPSYNQVTQPIYYHAQNRWKNYNNEMSSVYPKLETWIKKFNY